MNDVRLGSPSRRLLYISRHRSTVNGYVAYRVVYNVDRNEFIGRKSTISTRRAVIKQRRASRLLAEWRGQQWGPGLECGRETLIMEFPRQKRDAEGDEC